MSKKPYSGPAHALSNKYDERIITQIRRHEYQKRARLEITLQTGNLALTMSANEELLAELIRHLQFQLSNLKDIDQALLAKQSGDQP